MALGSSRLTEMSTRNYPGGKGRPARKADNLTAICEPNVCKLWEPQPLTTLRDSFTFYYRSQAFELCHILKGSVSYEYLYVTILPCILVTRQQYVLSFLCAYF
jgi:hypothetical protein